MSEHTILIAAPVRHAIGSIETAGFQVLSGKKSATLAPAPNRGALLVLVSAGQLSMQTQRENLSLSTGEGMVVSAPIFVRNDDSAKTASYLYLSFSGDLFSAWLNQHSPILGPAEDRGADVIAWLLQWIQQFGESDDTVRQVRDMAALIPFLCEQFYPQVAEADWAEVACRALKSHLDSEMDCAILANNLGMTYETFRKRFTLEVGESPVRYRNMARIDAAKQLILTSPQLTNSDLAKALGFNDEFHFSKRFRELAGVSVREFKTKHGEIVTSSKQPLRLA